MSTTSTPVNEENVDADGLGSFAVALAHSQAAERAEAGEVETEEEAERTAAFMERALAASAKMTAARDKDQLLNLLTVVALLRCQKLRAHATTAFVISLAASDLLFSAINLPLTASR